MLLHDPEEAADRGSERDPDTARHVMRVEPCVLDGLPPRLDREQDVPVEPAGLLRLATTVRRVEALDLGRDPHRELARVEGLDEVDAALAGDGGAPGRGRVVAERRDRPEPGDDDASP